MFHINNFFSKSSISFLRKFRQPWFTKWVQRVMSHTLCVLFPFTQIFPLKPLPLISVDGSLLESSCSLPRCDGVFDGLLTESTASFLLGVVLASWQGNWKAVELGHEAGGGLRTRCSCTCASVRGSASPNSWRKKKKENVYRKLNIKKKRVFQLHCLKKVSVPVECFILL